MAFGNRRMTPMSHSIVCFSWQPLSLTNDSEWRFHFPWSSSLVLNCILYEDSKADARKGCKSCHWWNAVNGTVKGVLIPTSGYTSWIASTFIKNLIWWLKWITLKLLQKSWIWHLRIQLHMHHFRICHQIHQFLWDVASIFLAIVKPLFHPINVEFRGYYVVSLETYMASGTLFVDFCIHRMEIAPAPVNMKMAYSSEHTVVHLDVNGKHSWLSLGSKQKRKPQSSHLLDASLLYIAFNYHLRWFFWCKAC